MVLHGGSNDIVIKENKKAKLHTQFTKFSQGTRDTVGKSALIYNSNSHLNVVIGEESGIEETWNVGHVAHEAHQRYISNQLSYVTPTHLF